MPGTFLVILLQKKKKKWKSSYCHIYVMWSKCIDMNPKCETIQSNISSQSLDSKHKQKNEQSLFPSLSVHRDENMTPTTKRMDVKICNDDGTPLVLEPLVFLELLALAVLLAVLVALVDELSSGAVAVEGL